MIKVKNIQLNEKTIDALNLLLDKEIPIKASFSLSMIAQELAPIVKLVQEKYNKILEKYAEKDKDGKVKYAVDSEGKEIPNKLMIKTEENFIKEMDELYNIENTINADNIYIEDLGNIDVKPITLMTLNFMLKSKDK
jgi:hypothetical protein